MGVLGYDKNSVPSQLANSGLLPFRNDCTSAEILDAGANPDCYARYSISMGEAQTIPQSTGEPLVIPQGISFAARINLFDLLKGAIKLDIGEAGIYALAQLDTIKIGTLLTIDDYQNSGKGPSFELKLGTDPLLKVDGYVSIPFLKIKMRGKLEINKEGFKLDVTTPFMGIGTAQVMVGFGFDLAKPDMKFKATLQMTDFGDMANKIKAKVAAITKVADAAVSSAMAKVDTEGSKLIVKVCSFIKTFSNKVGGSNFPGKKEVIQAITDGCESAFGVILSGFTGLIRILYNAISKLIGGLITAAMNGVSAAASFFSLHSLSIGGQIGGGTALKLNGEIDFTFLGKRSGSLKGEIDIGNVLKSLWEAALNSNPLLKALSGGAQKFLDDAPAQITQILAKAESCLKGFLFFLPASERPAGDIIENCKTQFDAIGTQLKALGVGDSDLAEAKKILKRRRMVKAAFLSLTTVDVKEVFVIFLREYVTLSVTLTVTSGRPPTRSTSFVELEDFVMLKYAEINWRSVR